MFAMVLAACSGNSQTDTPTATAAATARPQEHALASTNATTAVTVQYVQLVAISEVNGNPWTSVAEFNVLDGSGAVIPRSGWSVTVDSQELVGENAPASNAIDGDPNSFWHTEWYAASPPHPHAMTVNLGSAQAVGGFTYLPRQVGENGRIAGWRFYTSPDGVTWTLAASGTFPDGTALQTVMLPAPTVAQPPVLAAVANRSDTLGVAVSQALVASDSDGGTLSYSASGLPTGLNIDPAAGVISGTTGAVGVYPVSLQVTDSVGGMTTGSFTWTVVAPAVTTTTAQYVRLQALSEVNGNPWTSIAEFNVLDGNGAVLPRTAWKLSADSQELVGEYAPVANSIDGDPGSYWHTQWYNATAPLPHALTVNLGSPQSVGGFKYLPRQVGVNGRIANWNFYTSVDGVNWTLFSQGTFPNSSDEQVVLAPAQTVGGAAPTSGASATRAARIAAYASGPLIAATPWTAGEAVPMNAVRMLPTGDNIIYTVGGNTGNLVPVLGGTVLDGRPIVDGTAVAYVNGRILAASQAAAPTVASAANPAAVGLTETYFSAGNFQPANVATVQGCKSISTGYSFLGHYCFANGPASGSGNATAYAAGPYGAGLSPAYVYHANTWSEEFVVTDQFFGLVFANSATPINVEIDGVQVQMGPLSSTGSSGWTLTFDYHGVVKARTVRVVSAVGAVEPCLQGVALSSQGVVGPSTTSTDQMLVLGDSINATVVPITEAGAQMMSYWIERYLGFGAAINMAVGGSGYVSENPGSFNIPDLLANPVNQALIAGYAPNITHVIIGAGFNDRGLPVATVQASALASWRALRKLLPNAKISITDGWSGSSGPDANALALAAGLAVTFAQWGDSNSRLIHSIGTSTATAYVSGLGNAGTPIVAGNSSVYTSTDSVHPSPAGARYLARRLSTDIDAAWAGAY